LFKLKATKRRHQRIQHKIKKKLNNTSDTNDALIEQYIDMAEDKQTEMAKRDTSNARMVEIDAAHSIPTKPKPSLLQQSKNLGRLISALTCRLVCKMTISNQHHVTFAGQAMVAEYNEENTTVLVTYDSGADGHYISEKDRRKVGLPILRISTKKVGVANGDTCNGKYVTELPFPQLSKKAAEADTFNDFPTSLMSVGKTADNGNISIYTKEGVSVYKEEDVLITCKGEAILIGKRDERGRYRIPLVQNQGNWQLRQLTKHSKKYLQQANSVYDLPSTEEAIKWMHAVRGYPVKSTWLKAVKAGNYIEWPLLTHIRFALENFQTTKMFLKCFSCQYNVVGMVCRMNSHKKMCHYVRIVFLLFFSASFSNFISKKKLPHLLLFSQGLFVYVFSIPMPIFINSLTAMGAYMCPTF